MPAAFLNPDGQPLVQLSFANGWTASICIRPNNIASLAYWRTGDKSARRTLIGEQEATDDEIGEFLTYVQSLRDEPAAKAIKRVARS